MSFGHSTIGVVAGLVILLRQRDGLIASTIGPERGS